MAQLTVLSMLARFFCRFLKCCREEPDDMEDGVNDGVKVNVTNTTVSNLTCCASSATNRNDEEVYAKTTGSSDQSRIDSTEKFEAEPSIKHLTDDELFTTPIEGEDEEFKQPAVYRQRHNAIYVEYSFQGNSTPRGKDICSY